MWWNNGEDLLDYQKRAVPFEYELQVRLYMAILGIWQARFAVMLSPTHILYRVVYRDLDKEAMILKVCEDFWNNHVLAGIPPEPNGKEKDGSLALKAAKQFSPTPDLRKTVQLPMTMEPIAVEIMELQQQAAELSKKKDELEHQADALKSQIALAMQDSTEGYIDCPNGLTIAITFKPQKPRKSANFDRLMQDFPDAYDTCVKVPGEGPRPMKVKFL